MTNPPPIPQDPPLGPDVIEGLSPLPGLHEALAYIAKGNPPAANIVKLDPGLEGDEDDDLDPATLEARIEELMLDEEVTRKAGIYPYVLNGKERHLSLRAFSEKVKREAYTRQKGICAAAACTEKTRVFKLDEMEADHLDPWHAGGKSVLSNCQMLCKACNRRKSGI